MIRSLLSALYILNIPGSVSAKLDPVEKKREAASSVAEVMYRVATTEVPSETQKLENEREGSKSSARKSQDAQKIRGRSISPPRDLGEKWNGTVEAMKERVETIELTS